MRRLATVLFLAAALPLVAAGQASAAYTLVAPAAGSSTTLNKVKTDWTGACDPGLTCSSFTVAYSKQPDLDGAGRLVEYPSGTNHDPYELAFPDDAASGTVLSPTLDPATWHVQLQWRQCDASWNCTSQQTTPSSFRLAHSLLSPVARVTYRYTYLRQIDFNVDFTGNAPAYTVRGVVAVQKRRANGTRYWAPIWSRSQARYGQYGRTKTYFNWRAGRTARGTKLRIQGFIAAPGMRTRVVTTYTTST